MPRLLGDFAWAVWDAPEARLMLARDHSLERSLFYSRNGAFAAFATGYRPLLALPEVATDLNEIAVADMLLTTMSDDDQTFYKSIAWVRPAERVIISAAGVRRERLWEPGARQVAVPKRYGDIVEAARALFDEAVACRLRTVGPVVASVSGGLDSSAVAATAARLTAPRVVEGVCIVPEPGRSAPGAPGRFPDEAPYVEALASLQPNLRPHFVHASGVGEFLEHPSSFFLRFGAPMWAPNNGGWALTAYHKASELGASTILVGILGNHTVSARGWERLAALGHRRRWSQFASELLAICRSDMPAKRYLVSRSLASLMPGLSERLRQLRGQRPATWQDNPAPLNPDFVLAAGMDRRHASHGITQLDQWHPDARIANLRFAMLRSRMAMEARAAMRMVSGVTASDPFSHRPLIDFCVSLPDELFMQGGVDRKLARDLFADRLPPMILNNREIGLQNADWHARLAPHKDALLGEIDRLAASALAARLIDIPRMRRIAESWPTDAAQAAQTRWLERHVFLRALHVASFASWIDRGNA